MKARVTTIFTLLALVGASGGALALASGSGGPGASSAATSQYKPGKRCGHHKTRPKTCPKPHRHAGRHRGRHHHGPSGAVRGRTVSRAPATSPTTGPTTAPSSSVATVLGQGAPGSSTVSGVTTTSGATDLVAVYYYGPASCSSANPRASGPFTSDATPGPIESVSSKSCIAVLQATGSGQTGTVSVSVGGGDKVAFVNVLQLAPGASVLSSGQNSSNGSPSTSALATLSSTGGSELAVVGTDGNGGGTTISPASGMGLLPGFTPDSSSSAGQNGANMGIFSGSPAQSSASFGLSPAANWGTIALLVG